MSKYEIEIINKLNKFNEISNKKRIININNSLDSINKILIDLSNNDEFNKFIERCGIIIIIQKVLILLILKIIQNQLIHFYVQDMVGNIKMKIFYYVKCIF